ncbi:hypothetical protein [Lysobacter gummosus]|uniref:hypothetical protein n=1 Tax=Lysobacter gummosus TaxID=262324 RepID=UPI003628218E
MPCLASPLPNTAVPAICTSLSGTASVFVGHLPASCSAGGCAELNRSMIATVLSVPSNASRLSLSEDLMICAPLAVAAAIASESPSITPAPDSPSASSGKPISRARGAPST